MSVEEVKVGLKNALVRGQTIEKATQSLLLAGYNPQEVQQAVRETNMGVIGNIGVVGESENTSREFKKLPTENVQQSVSDWDSQENSKPKKIIPKWLIISLISVGALILVIVLLGVFGKQILTLMRG